MKKIWIALSILSFAFGAPLATTTTAIPKASAGPRLCEITGIHDGDSLRVSCQSRALRLACIDAPELDQPFGQEARDYLGDLTIGREVEVIDRGDGGFNRVASIVYVDNANIQERLLSAGLAWYYPQYASKCSDFMGLKRAEQSARERGIGIWKSTNPIAPWLWRKGIR
ncbi:thermonuclease family protein [Pannus brasiliensis CCIBt3594]|uniref:Thermonuclease family protein n=1 Tax=Pannus brasiliensis CCIBt3594 TaxID=1427578 RepID=A0AAW9QY08_9CHRO